MCVCVCVCVCVCTYTYMYTNTHTHTHTYTSYFPEGPVSRRSRRGACVYTFMFVCVFVCVRAWVRVVCNVTAPWIVCIYLQNTLSIHGCK